MTRNHASGLQNTGFKVRNSGTFYDCLVYCKLNYELNGMLRHSLATLEGEYNSMNLLFYYLAPLQNDTNVTSQCMLFIFGDKGAATCLIREYPTRD